MRSIFNRIVKDFKVSVAGTGFAPSADKFTDDWTSALKKHYERVQNAFTGEVLNQQRKCNVTWIETKQDEDSDEEKAALLAIALQKWKEDHSGQSASFISQTTQKNFNAALDEAREIIREQNLSTDRLTLALTAAAILKGKFSGRVDTILMFETQQAAESAKLAEAEVLSGIEPSILTGIAAITGIVKKKHGGRLEISGFGCIIKGLMGKQCQLMSPSTSGVSC